jgi:hypothetical protein
LLKRFVLGLALGAWPALGGGWPSASPSITLYTAFQQEPPAAVVDAIHDELEQIMIPVGLRFDWYALSEAGGRVSFQLAVIHFKGECDAADMRPELGYPGPLGWTHITDGKILPFIDINCERIRLVVQRRITATPLSGRDAILGRAIARVLAHELYHFLAHTKHHSGSGIAKASYTAEDLLAPTLRFGKKECAMLRSQGLSLLAESSAAPDSGQ